MCYRGNGINFNGIKIYDKLYCKEWYWVICGFCNNVVK